MSVCGIAGAKKTGLGRATVNFDANTAENPRPFTVERARAGWPEDASIMHMCDGLRYSCLCTASLNDACHIITIVNVSSEIQETYVYTLIRLRIVVTNLHIVLAPAVMRHCQ